MSLQVVVDMNLSPAWVGAFIQNGWPAAHWSTIGDPRAADRVIMAWALANQHIVFTHDLDFGTILALTHAMGPSVLQVRAANVLPDHLAPTVVAALRQHEAALLTGAIVVIDERRCRVRVLPL